MSSISGISGYMSYAYTQGIASSGKGKGPDDLFKKIDTDGSGKVSQAELEAFTKQMSRKTETAISTDDAISTYDTDGDGELSSTELKGFLDANKPKQSPMDMMMGMMGGMGMMGMPPGPSPEEKFNEADSDGSGGLSQTELDALVSGISEATGTSIDTTDAVSAYDSDGDGELSMDEVQSFLDASGVKPPVPPEMSAAVTGNDSSPDDLFSSLTDSAISTYDTDGDGNLSNTELKSFLTDNFSKLFQDYISKALNAYASASTDETSSSVSLDA
jgi:Ca2+-binding EF-hand superfamily protein